MDIIKAWETNKIELTGYRTDKDGIVLQFKEVKPCQTGNL